jgi:hypothetical protein
MQRIKFYEGEYNGNKHQSIYPCLFRAQYKRMIAGRLMDIDKIVSGHDALSARSNMIFRDPHGEIRGDIVIEHVLDLSPVYA